MSYAIFFPQLNLREGAMLDFWGVVAVVVAIAVNLTAIATIMPRSLAGRLALAALSGAWVGAAAALAAAGELADATSRLIPLIGVLFAAPLLFMALWALISARLRTMLFEIPMPLLIGLNIMRVFGLFFVLLASAGRLGGPFPYSAGWGDVITGVAAIPVAYLAARDAARHARVIAAWNLFGTLDLIVAVFLGVTSTNGSSLQLIDAGAGSAAMQYLPYSLVPTVLVPFYLVTHAIIFVQLASSRRVLRPA
jgi:hypothetical protein